MDHICDSCGAGFGSRLDLELHRDTCGDDQLVCRRCGERFDADRATRDGWHYRCPGADCDGEGIGEDLVTLDEVRVAAEH